MGKIEAVGFILLASAMSCSAPALAAPIAFDCDVPPNHYSSVSQDVAGSIMIGGTVQAVEMRSGNNLPVAGARLLSADGNDSVGFQLVAASARAKQFDVILSTKLGNDVRQSTVAQIPADPSIRFSLSLNKAGSAVLAINRTEFSASFMALPTGKAMAFCSTGQFKFSDLSFSQNDEGGAMGTG